MTAGKKFIRKPGTGAKVFVAFIILMVVLFLMEGVLSVVLYQKNGPYKLATVEIIRTTKALFTRHEFPVNVEPHILARPDSSREVNGKIADEAMKSNRFVQDSWVEFRNMDFNGAYMHMKGAIRKTQPEAFYNPSSRDTITIYFFGGSTMFGFNVLDHETIPSQFVQQYKQKFPNGKSIRVYNYGTPTYYSFQELILFSNLIFEGHKPDIIVFLDGINDFWFATAAYYRQSYFSYVFRQVFDKGLKSNGNFQLVDTAEAMFADPKNIPATQYNDKLVLNYFENLNNIRMMAKMVSAKPYFFCQPSPFYNYPNQQKDPICFKDTNTRFNNIYPMVKKQTNNNDFFFLGDLLHDEKGYPFIDGLHYSPAFIKKVAAMMLDKMNFEE
ncbi:MAG TPA: SGNH/GDSL hydrolase family protein [Flavitalea sp.]|nr:SGNH/GDSL hydrolase family protein [Flavitalea sp.]